MVYYANLMSFPIRVKYPLVFDGTVHNRISRFITDDLRKNTKEEIVIEIEALESKLPVNSVIPIARIENGSLIFERYDMSGKFSGNTLKVKLLNNIFSFDTAMRVLFSYLLIQNGGFLIHSSSISLNGKGILFVGVSGSGKTTIARLSDKHSILSDEISAISKRDGRYYLHGNTFFNDLNDIGPNEKAGLNQVYILKKAKYNRVERADKNSCFSNFIRNIMCFTKDQETSEKIIENIVNLAESVSIDNLYFLPHISVYDTINAHQAGIN